MAFGDSLRTLRLRRGLSLAQLGKLAKYSRQRVWDVETKRRAASLEFALAVDNALGAGGELLRLVDAADPSSDSEQGVGLDVGWTAAGTLAALRQVCEAGRVDRRRFIALTGAALTAPAHGWLIAASAHEVGRDRGAPIDDGVVDHLDEIVGQFRQMDDRLGGGSLIGVVEAQAGYVAQLLDERRYSDTVGRRLHGTAAELLRLGGWLSFDAGHHGQAQRYFIAALHAAHTAGDRALGANILGFMSCQAKDVGQIADAVTLAETARAGYPGASPRVAAILDLRAAEAYANSGTAEMRNCQAAIDSAFSHLGQATPQHGEPAWSYWLDPAQVHAQAGYCHLKLENWAPAQSHLRAALDAQSDAYGREGALRRILLATAYARDSEPERACAAGHEAIDLLDGQVDSARCVGHLGRLRDALKRFSGNATVRAFAERSRPLVAT